MATTAHKKGILDYIWDSDRHLKSPAERKLVLKLDALILSSIILANAYVSGLKEDLNIQGNQYTFMQSIYNAALCICTIPGALIATKIRPSVFLASCEVGWMIFTFAQAGATSCPQMYAFRWFVGMFEAPFAAVAVIQMGNWYTKAEAGKRIGLWYISGQIGGATAGFLQSAIFASLDGRLGLPGWRWMYIVCGLMTLPSAVLIYFILPDYPQNTRSRWITPEEKEMAIARSSKTKPFTGKIDPALAKSIFGSWRPYFILPIYIYFACSVQTAQYFAVYLKAAGYSTVARTNLNACRSLIGIPIVYFYSFMSDYTRSRWAWCCFPMIVACIPIGILAIYPPSVKLKVAAFLLADLAFITPVYFTWINDICHAHPEERAFMAGAANALFYMVNSWLPILIFKQTWGPRFKVGFATTWAFALGTPPLMALLRYMHVRQMRQEKAAAEAAKLEGEQTGSAVESEEDVKEKKADPPVVLATMVDSTLV
ncbi:pantothenate transporter liz1 [Pseudohyphozyma bogoriensis]|nr:pantothenate transporter liz1 [Pseudohyphozyma bogoriensis]